MQVTLCVEDLFVVLSVPGVQGLVQAVQPVTKSVSYLTYGLISKTQHLPVRGGGEVGHSVSWYGTRNKCGNGMAEENICFLDKVPDKVPNTYLRRLIAVNKITPDLDMGAEEYRSVWRDVLDQRYQANHLRIVNLHSQRQYLGNNNTRPSQHKEIDKTYNNDISTALFRPTQRPTVGKPVTLRIVGNPVNDGRLFCVRDMLVLTSNALQDIMDILGNTENSPSRLGDWRTRY